VLELLSEARRAAAACAEAPAWAVPDRDLVGCLQQAWAGVQQLTAVTAHLISQAQTQGLPQTHAATSTAVWLRQHLRVSPATATRLVKLADALNTRPVLDTAVCTGTISTEHATTIATTLADLPPDLGREVTDKAEAMLIDWADDFDPITLGKLGARILEYVAPEIAEQREAEFLARQEAKAHRKRGFTLSPLGNGQVRLSGYLDTTGAATVTAALDPLCHPRHDPAEERTPAQRRADALIDICTGALRHGPDLPGHGHDPVQVVVTIPFTTLTDHLQPTAQPRPTKRTRPAERPGPAGQSGQSGPAEQSTPVEQSGPAEQSRPAGQSGPAGQSTPAGQSGPVGRSGQHGATCRLRADGSSATAEPATAEPATATSSDTTATATGTSGGQARDPAPHPNTPTSTDIHNRPRAGDGPGRLDTGAPISPAEARRLACDAHILPAILGGDSQVLDLGRTRRLFTGPIRRALILRDRGCTFPQCDRPARWAEGHHLRPWADGGTTTLTNACLICRRHHRLLHNNSGWQAHLSPDGHPEFLPPATIDPQRRPQRNTFHHRQ